MLKSPAAQSIRLGKTALLLFATIATVTAVAHLSCIMLGEQCYRAQMAPEVIVQSAMSGTWLAPSATLLLSALFLLCAAYALSVIRWLPKLPLTHWAIYIIASICLIRGAATLPLSLLFPSKVSVFSTLAGLIWFIAGALCLTGYRHALKEGNK